MARNSEYLKMQEMGEWLERLLSDKVENWELKELFKDAVEILNLEYKIPHEHPFFLNLDELTKRNNNWSKWTYYLPIEYDPSANRPDFAEQAAHYTNFYLFTASYDVRRSLKSMCESSQPWYLALNTMKEKSYEAETEEKREKLDKLLEEEEPREFWKEKLENDPDFAQAVAEFNIVRDKKFDFQVATSFDSLYSQIGEKLIVGPNGYSKVNVLLTCHENNKITVSMTTAPNEPLPFNVFISRIFFDFLLMGGQEYYVYCAHCGKFIVAQRKGRRKTCSDACRLALFHKKK